MASENESTKLPFNGETGNARNRGKSRNGKGVKKIPQRGVGVEKLEKMRVKESLKSFHQQQQQLLVSYGGFHFPQQQQQQVIINNNNMNNVVGSGFSGSGFSPFVGNKSGFGVGASSSSWFGRNPFENSSKELSSIPNLNHHHQSLEQQQQVMNNNNNSMNNVVGSGFSPFVGNKSGFGVGASSSSSNGYGWFGRNPFENSSKELSSIPNLNHHHQSLDLCLKISRLSEENIMTRGANYAKRDMPLEIWNPHHVHHGFPGFMPQPKSSVSAYYPTQNHDECVEVVAVHRKGNSSFGSGRVFMEYDFFPEKDGKNTTTIPKDFFPTATSGETSSSITAASYGDASMAYDSLDLSLRL